MAKKNTKTKILDAAEALFSKEGIAKTSLRTIIAKANVNIAAIHYHFGSKKEVVSAVYLRRLQPINEKRSEKLRELKELADDSPLAIEDIVRAFLMPILICESVTPSAREKMRRLFSHINSEPEEVAHITEVFKDVFEQYIMAISEALPELPKTGLILRFMFMVGVMMGSMMKDHMFRSKLNAEGEEIAYEEILDQAVQFISAGFKADKGLTK